MSCHKAIVVIAGRAHCFHGCFQQFLQNRFLQDDHHGILEDVEVTLIEITQASDPTKREYYWIRNLHLDGLNLESDY